MGYLLDDCGQKQALELMEKELLIHFRKESIGLAVNSFLCLQNLIKLQKIVLVLEVASYSF